MNWQLGRVLLISGLAIAAVGLFIMFSDKLPGLSGKYGLFRLPGDIVVEKWGVRVYLPITTCVIISIVLSAILWFFGRK